MKESSTMTDWDRSFCLVRGYHEHSYPPPLAYDSQLRHRFAVVLHSDREGTSDFLFDAEFFLELSKTMQAGIECDTAIMMLGDLGEVHSLHELNGIYSSADEPEREPPTEIYYREESRLICMEQTEFWCGCGGGGIYTDSYTFSYYTATDSFDLFAAECHNMCDRNGFKFPEVITAATTKLPFIPWYRRPLSLFGMKAW